MKILILTSTELIDANAKVHFIIDKIVAYYKGQKDTVISMLDGSKYHVKESVKFITQQLVAADVNSYIVYNSEEHA